MELLRGPVSLCLTAALMALVLPGTAGASQRSPVEAAAASRNGTVTVTPADPSSPSRSFAVVLRAATPAARVKGLQGSRALLPGEAALFIFDPPQQVSFWMASLSYAIDIIYIDSAGMVTEVFRDCQPESQEIFSSKAPVSLVLETAAGAAIRPGDRVRLD